MKALVIAYHAHLACTVRTMDFLYQLETVHRVISAPVVHLHQLQIHVVVFRKIMPFHVQTLVCLVVDVSQVHFVLVDHLHLPHVLQGCTVNSPCLVHHQAFVHEVITVLAVIFLHVRLCSFALWGITVQGALVIQLHVQ